VGKAPAFQFYANDFVTGTMELSLEELGAYVRLLALSWDKGPLPLDERRRANLLGVSLSVFRRVWNGIADKWAQTDAGYINLRLEQQRADLEAFQKEQAHRGRLSGESRRRTKAEPKHEPNTNGGSSAVRTEHATEREPNANSSSSVFDLRSSEDQDQDQRHTPRARATTALSVNPHSKPTNLVNGSELRRHGQHAWCSWPSRDGLCVPVFLHDEFVGKLGAVSLTDVAELKGWYAGTVARFEGIAIGEDSLQFWRNEFASWVGTVTSRPGVSTSRTGGSVDAAKAYMAEQIRQIGGVK
jgi:uncharacterized protein YdaU (DUF1376 family)